jgi:wyosine [tRNA(Phe)-imidazoG37] synthetase (radical SAM superfamily)
MDQMLEEFREIDRNMIREKYETMVKGLEKLAVHSTRS